MAGTAKRRKNVEPFAKGGKRIAAGEEKGRLGKKRCVACNAELGQTIKKVFMHPGAPPRWDLHGYCRECRKIARLRLPFPLLRKRVKPDENAHPVIPFDLYAGCKVFLSSKDDKKVRDEIGCRLFKIFHLADNGDEKALTLLIDVAKRAVEGLESIAHRQPHLLRPFARKSSLWPSFIGRKTKALSSWHRTRLRELQIGADNPYAGNWQIDSPATQTAVLMHRWLQLNQGVLRLPLPNEAGAAPEWFEVGWRALLLRTDGHPEKDDFLKQLGQRDLWRTAARYKGYSLPIQSEAVNRRAEIKRRVKQAYLGFVRNVLAAQTDTST